MKRNDLNMDRFFSRLESPDPPHALREKTLEKTIEALTQKPLPDRWTRLWENRTARVAWAACVLALIAGHTAVTARVPHRESMQSQKLRPLDLCARGSGNELAEILCLPKMREDVIPRAHYRQFLDEFFTGTAAPVVNHRKENKS